MTACGPKDKIIIADEMSTNRHQCSHLERRDPDFIEPEVNLEYGIANGSPMTG